MTMPAWLSIRRFCYDWVSVLQKRLSSS